MPLSANSKIILIDGVCNLCLGLVRFILKNERTQDLQFASIQDSIGAELMAQFGLKQNDLSSVILIKEQQIFRFSDAALEISKELRAPWSWASYLKFIPRPIRDLAYLLIAKSRYRIFGKQESCFVPTPDLSARFLK